MLSDNETFCSGDEACSVDIEQPLSTHKVLSQELLGSRSSASFESPTVVPRAAATMSVAAQKDRSPTLTSTRKFPLRGYEAPKNPLRKQKHVSLSPGGKQIWLVRGTRVIAVLALWSFFVVLWMTCFAPETQHEHSSDMIRLVRHEHIVNGTPMVVLVLIGALLLTMSLLVYGLARPKDKASVKLKLDAIDPSPLHLESRVATKSPRRADSSSKLVRKADSPSKSVTFRSDSDVEEDGFVSCDEDDLEKAVLPGFCSIVGFLVEEGKLPDDAGARHYELLVEDIHRRCSLVAEISMDQALRLSLGLNFDAPAIVQKWSEICVWRDKHDMSQERARCAWLQLPSVTEAVTFPHQDEIYKKAFVAKPCALVSRSGEPVSLWLIGASSSCTSPPASAEHIDEWSRAVFEYADVWAQTQSHASGRLLGQVQVFDMAGVGLRQMMNSALQEQFKRALGCGGNYVELVSHIYVINASWTFSKLWALIKKLISPRTASKVTVSTDMPKEFLDTLTSESAKMLPELLKTSRHAAFAKVQRPPGQQHSV